MSLIAFLLCLLCTLANDFTHRDGNALSCGFYSKFNWKRFLFCFVVGKIHRVLVFSRRNQVSCCQNNFFMAKNGFPTRNYTPLHISAILTKRNLLMSLIFRDLSFEKWLEQSPCQPILVKFCRNVDKR